MSKRISILISTILLAATGFSASAATINFQVQTWNFAYHAEGDVQLVVATGDWSEQAFVNFVRGTPPTDRIYYDPSSGYVTLTYSIDELPNIQTLLNESSSVFFNYQDFGVSETGYLYSNP